MSKERWVTKNVSWHSISGPNVVKQVLLKLIVPKQILSNRPDVMESASFQLVQRFVYKITEEVMCIV